MIMYVKTRMSAHPFTVKGDAPLTDVIELMHEKGLKRVPVVAQDGKTVVGIITDGDIQKMAPSKATTLSIFEINYLLGKAKASSAMTKNVITIAEDALLEDAAVMMRANKISSLIVLDKSGHLAGIITESDIFDAFLDLMGFRDKGSRITVEAPNAPGVLADVTKIFGDFKFNISHLAVYNGNKERCDVVVRFNAYDTKELEKVLQDKGYEILHLLHSEER